MQWSYKTEDLLQALGLDGSASLAFGWHDVQLSSPKKILLTGATGWLGKHVLRDVLFHTQAQVVLLVRSAQKLMLPDHPQAVDRIQIIEIADLCDSLAHVPSVDAVVHVAADMSLSNTLLKSWSTNVLSTQHLYRWAEQRHVQHFVHVSTLSVFVSSRCPPAHLHEHRSLLTAKEVFGGYASSKWCAEAWLLAQNTVPVSIHRLGLLSHSSLGWAPHDPLYSIASAWKTFGRPTWFVPNEEDKTDITPTDYVSMGLVQSLQTPQVYHWAGQAPHSSQTLYNALKEAFGDQEGFWPDDLRPARRALGRYSDPARAQKWWWHDVFQSSHHTYDTHHADQILPRPQVNQEDLVHWFKGPSVVSLHPHVPTTPSPPSPSRLTEEEV